MPGDTRASSWHPPHAVTQSPPASAFRREGSQRLRLGLGLLVPHGLAPVGVTPEVCENGAGHLPQAHRKRSNQGATLSPRGRSKRKVKSNRITQKPAKHQAPVLLPFDSSRCLGLHYVHFVVGPPEEREGILVLLKPGLRRRLESG